MRQNLLLPFQHYLVDGTGPLFHHRGRYLPATGRSLFTAQGLVSTHGPFSVTAMQCSK